MNLPTLIRTIIGSFMVLVCLVCASAKTRTGSIQGFVVDEEGKPVSEAGIIYLDIDLPKNTVEVWGRAIPLAETDSQGHFAVDGLTLGHRYKVYASKEQAGYPNMMMSAYNQGDKAVIAKAMSKDKAMDIKIRIGPKAARLKWDVKDAVTGSPINPTVGIERVDSGDGFGGGAPPNEGFLVPSDTDLFIKVSENGFQDWYYPGVAKKELAAPLRLRPGQERILELQLQPDAR